MSSYIDTKFLNLLSNRLTNFSQKKPGLWNFRCPHCGDSQKSKSKSRGFVYEKKNNLFFKCHNCGMGQSLGNFIRFLDGSLHKEYVLERYKDSKPVSVPDFKMKPVKFEENSALKKLVRYDRLDKTHPAYEFITRRKIPEEHLDKLFFCPKFYKWVNGIIPKKLPTKNDHPRVIIPFYDRSGKFFAFQGRAFGQEQPKYVTIKLDDSKEKIYGLDRLDLNKPVNIVEGPIDSLFLDNCIAMAGADISLKIPSDQCTMIFDNEPRNEQIVNRMINAVHKNYKVVIFPESLKYKDINDMVIHKNEVGDVSKLIYNNRQNGLAALQSINKWKRI